MSGERNFETDFEQALKFLNLDSNLEILENFVKSYLTSNAEYSNIKFINFQVTLNDFLGNHLSPIIHFLKTKQDLNYNGQHKQIYKRLLKLKRLSQLHLMMVESSVNSPNKLKANVISIDQNKEVSLTLVNNNSANFQTFMDFNAALNLSLSLVSRLNNRLDLGEITIDENVLNGFLKEISDFNNKIIKIKADQNEQ